MENFSTLEKHESIYSSMVSFYSLAEDLISSVEDDISDDFAQQLDFIEPLVEDLENSTDVLVNYYRDFVKTGKKPNFFAKKKIEKSIITIQSVIFKCRGLVKNKKNKNFCRIEG